MAWRRQLLFSAVLVLTSTALCGAALEVFVRVGLGDRDYALEMWRYAHILKRVSADRAQVFAHAPGAEAHLMGVDVRINAHGLRGRAIDYPKAPGMHRVLMLGDSLTFGWGVAEPDVTSTRLEALLRARDPAARWEVINSGVGNYNTRLEVHYLEREGLRYAPDVVVLNYFINDAEPDPRYSGNALNRHSAAWVFLANRLDVLRRRATRQDAWDAYYRGLYRADAAGWRGARAALGRFGALCRERSLRCLVVHQPELHQLDPYPFPDAARALADACAEADLPLLDLLPAVRSLPPSSLWVSVQDPHPNARADAVYASVIAERLRPTPRAP